MRASTSVSVALTLSVLFLSFDFYSASSRGYPDVSAQYYNYTMIFEGEDGISAGSSTAATVRIPLLFSL